MSKNREFRHFSEIRRSKSSDKKAQKLRVDAELREIERRQKVKRLLPFDKNAGEFIFGDQAIGEAMGYSPDYAVDKFYPTNPTSGNWLDADKTVRWEQNSTAHWYVVDRERVTHPNSGTAAGKTARAETKQALRDAVPGWKLDVRAPSKKRSSRKK